MRDLTGRRSFRWKKKLEHTLHVLFPKTFVPLYDLVSFSTVPYAEAKARGLRNDLVIKRLMYCVVLGLVVLIVFSLAQWAEFNHQNYSLSALFVFLVLAIAQRVAASVGTSRSPR
jgi:cell division protein FtsW (lipid II flippase)